MKKQPAAREIADKIAQSLHRPWRLEAEQAIAAALSAATEAGWRAGVEAAAQAADEIRRLYRGYSAADKVADAIRALPYPAPEPQVEPAATSGGGQPDEAAVIERAQWYIALSAEEAAKYDTAEIARRAGGGRAMTHPLVEAAATVLAEAQCQHLFAALPDEVQQAFREDAQRIVAALLRHPAMREPSEAASQAMDDAWDDGASREAVWAAGIDALAREIEEASRG